MKKTLFALFILCTTSIFSQVKNYTSFSDFNKDYLKDTKNDSVLIVNFWATWCAPCVKELPFFEKLPKTIAGKKVEVVLVSLDFKSQIQKRLIPFINKRKLKNKVVVLTDGNANSWINKVDSKWSGAIPATLILHKNKKAFYEKSYNSQKELEKDIKTLITQP